MAERTFRVLMDVTVVREVEVTAESDVEAEETAVRSADADAGQVTVIEVEEVDGA